MQTLLSQVLQVSFVFCFRYMKSFVFLAITFMLNLVVYLAQTVLWTWKRPPATSQVRTMHHSSWRPGLPSGATGTILASLHFWISHAVVGRAGLRCHFLRRDTCWAVQCNACCGCRNYTSQLAPTLTTVMMKGRREDTSLSFRRSLIAWQDAW